MIPAGHGSSSGIIHGASSSLAVGGSSLRVRNGRINKATLEGGLASYTAVLQGSTLLTSWSRPALARQCLARSIITLTLLGRRTRPSVRHVLWLPSGPLVCLCQTSCLALLPFDRNQAHPSSPKWQNKKRPPLRVALHHIPAVGLEPTRSCEQQILSLSCLPISPRRQVWTDGL